MDNRSKTPNPKNLVIFLAVCFLPLASCVLGQGENDLEQSNFSFLQDGYIYDQTKLALSDFTFLREGISYHDIVSEVGPPAEDVGSGLWIFRYPLKDGRTLSLTFSSLDHLDSGMVSIIDQEGEWEKLELPIRLGD